MFYLRLPIYTLQYIIVALRILLLELVLVVVSTLFIASFFNSRLSYYIVSSIISITSYSLSSVISSLSSVTISFSSITSSLCIIIYSFTATNLLA